MNDDERRDRHNRLAAIGAITCLLERPAPALSAETYARVKSIRAEMIDAIHAQTEAMLDAAHAEEREDRAA